MKEIPQYNQDILDDVGMNLWDWCSLVACATSGSYNTGEHMIDHEIQEVGIQMTKDKVLSNRWGAKPSKTVRYICKKMGWEYEKVVVGSDRFWNLLKDGKMLTISFKPSNAYGRDRRDDGVVNNLQPEWKRDHLVSVLLEKWKYYIVDNYYKDLPQEYQKRFWNVYINAAFEKYVENERFASCYYILKKKDRTYWAKLVRLVVNTIGYDRFNKKSQKIIDEYLT